MGNFGKFWAVSVLEEPKRSSVVACGGERKTLCGKNRQRAMIGGKCA